MTHQQSLRDAALHAAARGWHVFPLRPGSKQPALHGADRCQSTGDCVGGHLKWEQRATTDPRRIVPCWETSLANVAIATGPSGLVVVDLDVPKEKSSAGTPDGVTFFLALCERAGQPWPTTFTVRTSSGGMHLYFTAPPGTRLTNTAGKLAPLVDTRAWGGYVVAPGSTVNGAPYTVTSPWSVAELPAWLLAPLQPAALPPQRDVRVSLASRSRSARYLRAAVEDELQRVTRSGPNQHNTALYRASVALGQLVAGGELAAHEVTEWLVTASSSVGQGEREARATIASGLRAGAKRPRRMSS
ncbi:bifunctional DNA primase/polymerase [Streptomyces sp. NPDC001068]|uniref:bifunctional DNA primase/polymerase n=1 Tax=Streptomyces sp. NPDC001068 TaxID=3364544 RepID=UPI0036D0EE17